VLAKSSSETVFCRCFSSKHALPLVSAPARDPVREQVVALRQRNLSVYDIQRELAAGRHPIGINALTILLREEGFARLPRRRDEERPLPSRPTAPGSRTCAVRIPGCGPFRMSPRSFRTTLAGPYLPYAACLRRIRRSVYNGS